MSNMNPTPEHVGLAEQEIIDRICMEFEDGWRAGSEPRLEAFLSDYESPLRRILLRELLLIEIAYLRDQGKKPIREAYIGRFPQDAEILSVVFMPTCEQGPIYESGDCVGPYRIERLLGGGSFGEVYLAADKNRNNQAVAIKVPAGGRFSSPDAVDHFLEEARTAQKLKHPAIVQASDVLRDDDGRPLIVMQFIDGESLRQRLRRGRFSPDDAVSLLIQISEAIDYAHRQGIIHRDLEPGNILLDKDGRPYVADFGLAIDEQSQAARAGESAGSLAYMSPEQSRGESHWLDGRADIWSLGVMLYEMLTGRRPFTGRDMSEFREQIEGREAKPLRQIDGELPPELERICLKCLHKAVVDRYATGKDLASDLRRFVEDCSIDSTNTNVSRGFPLAFHAGSPSQQSPYPILLGSLLAAVVMATLVMGFGLIAPGRGASLNWPDAPSVSSSLKTAPTLERDLATRTLEVEEIELSVWVPGERGDRRNGEISRRTSTRAALRIGDRIRLSVRLSKPAYVYVFWLDPDAALLPIYPWNDGHWDCPPEKEQLVCELTLPAERETAWPILPGPGGTATVFVCASQEPIDFGSREKFPEFTKELQPQTEHGSSAVLWFQDGIESRGQTRAPGLSKAVDLADPVLINQQLLFQRLGQSAGTSAAMCFPILGNDANRREEKPKED